MEFLDLEPDADARNAKTLVVALDGWTDAGRGGTIAAEHLRGQFPTAPLGSFDPDLLFDFRDRRPLLAIDRGELGEPQWPSLEITRVDLPGASILLLEGAEPDFRWPTLLDDLVELCDDVGVTDYVGLGAVPGPVPHTRPVRVITTSSESELLDRHGRPHEQVVVPASCQVVIETAMRDAGRRTLGLWARVPHYVAGEYPAAAVVLLHQLADHLDFVADTAVLEAEAADNERRLEEAADASPEIRSHIEALEGAYDADVADDAGISGPLPTGDQIAAELERFLRNQSDE